MGKPQFRYFDLNNNVYTVEDLKVDYVPVTKETASNGKYDGGKPAKGKLTKKGLEKVNEKITTIADSKSLRMKHRSGQCAMLLLYLEDKNKRYILPASSEQGKLEEMLKASIS